MCRMKEGGDHTCINPCERYRLEPHDQCEANERYQPEQHTVRMQTQPRDDIGARVAERHEYVRRKKNGQAENENT